MRKTFFLAALATLGMSCAPEPAGPLDDLATAPVLGTVAPAAVIVNSDTMNIGPTRLPSDELPIGVALFAAVSVPAGSSPLEHVSAWIYDDRGVEIRGPFGLNDQGVAPDVTAGDGVFSGSAWFTIVRVEVGTWTARVAATGRNGSRSATAIVPVTVMRNNRPPVISDLVALASISSSDPQPLMQLRVKAVDPDGMPDLLRVSFNSFRPNGLPASGNPFLMFDDGQASGVSGDTMAGDSVYSLRVQFGGAPAGTYRFEFRALDRSSDTSNVIIHHVEVTP